MRGENRYSQGLAFGAVALGLAAAAPVRAGDGMEANRPAGPLLEGVLRRLQPQPSQVAKPAPPPQRRPTRPPQRVPTPAAGPGPTHVVEAELLAKSRTPAMKDIWVYREGLSVYAYRVGQVRQGELKAGRICVTHWAVKRGIVQPITDTRIGEKLVLKLRPFEDVAKPFEDVYRSETIDVLDMPRFHDVGQRLIMPADEAGRWNYRVEVGRRLRALLRLRNQLKLVVLGDCQAWFANNTEHYYGEENRKTPVALGLFQERAGLYMHRLLVEHYLVHLPRLEWVILTWNPRYVNGAWTYGAKARAFEASPGFRYDRDHAAEVLRVVDHPPLTTDQVAALSDIGPWWRRHPYGEIRGVKYGRSARPEVLGNQRKLGWYRFAPDQWEHLEAIARALAARKVRLLAFTTPVHPETARQQVKDKSGVAAKDYQDQVARLKAMEARYPGNFFFYDVNNMGDNGLDDRDFGNIDHCTDTGAEKTTREAEARRRRLVEGLK